MRHYVWYADSSEMPFLPPGQEPNVWNGLDKTRCLLWKHATGAGTGKENWEWGGRLPTPGEDLCIYRWVNKDSNHKKGLSKASCHTYTFTYVHHVPAQGWMCLSLKLSPLNNIFVPPFEHCLGYSKRTANLLSLSFPPSSGTQWPEARREDLGMWKPLLPHGW